MVSAATGEISVSGAGDPVVVASPAVASPPPLVIRGRGATTLARTRASVLIGARRCLLRFGTRRTTMADIATASGIAKATLYNHFRTKPDVWRALAQSEVGEAAQLLTEAARRDGPVAALTACAQRLAGDEAVRRLAETEPAVWAALVLPGAEPDAAWAVAREAVADLLGVAGRPAVPDSAQVDVVLRWLVSQLVWPATPDQLREAAIQLVG